MPIAIDPHTTPPNWQYDDTTPVLEIYANETFKTPEGKTVLPGDPAVPGSPCLRFVCSVASNVLSIPQVPAIDPTEDSLTNQQATYSAFLRVTGQPPIPFLERFPLAPLTQGLLSTSWTRIEIHANGVTARNSSEIYTKTETDQAIEAAALAINYAPASPTVKGITRISVPAVDPLDPEALSSNDTRVPTQGESDALAGTDGTPSSANPYVTNSDPRVNTSSLTNVRLAKTANYTLANTDAGKTIALGGGNYFTLTVGAASGFDADFMVVVLNEDTARAKIISINGMADFLLYPLQEIILNNQNSVWRLLGKSRWRCPSGTVVYVDTVGSDTNDGLATGATGALLTPQAAINRIKADFDLANVGPTPVVVQLADGTYTKAGAPVILADGPFFGYQPTTLIFPGANEPPVSIRGNAVNPENVILHNTGTVLGSVLAIVGACIGVQDVKITSASGNGLHVAQAVLFFGNVILGACGASKIFLSHSSVIENYDNWFIEGNSVNVISANYLSAAYIVGHTLTLLSDMTVTEFVLAARNSDLTFQDTINAGGFTVTGKRFTIHSGAAINTNSSLAPAQFNYFPGTVDGTLFGFGSYDTSATTRSPIDVSANEIKLGSDSGVFTRTNNTLKVGHLAVPPYANASLDFFPLAIAASVTDNVLGVGGGGTGAAATLLRLITAANNNTATGTDRVTIDSAGLVSFLSGLVSMISLPAFANNAAAIGGGLAVGRLYRTGADPDTVCVVH